MAVPSARCARALLRCAARWGLLTQASVAIDGSKFKAVNNRDRNFTRAKMEQRMAQIEESVARYLQQLDSADRQEPSEALKTKTSGLKEKIEKLKQEMRRLAVLEMDMLDTPDHQISLTDLMPARWRPAAAAPAWWATTSRLPSRPGII
jgi:ABC-type phosphate transport system auxiliary subunit